MFDAFNGSARRAVSYARYEALARMADDVDTHHLLLGVLRENDELTRDVISSFGIDAVRFHKLWPQLIADPEASSSDIAFSDDAKKALVFTKNEADALGAPAVAPLHMLLGLLRVRNGVAANALTDAGMTYEAVGERSRSHIEQLGARNATTEITSIVLRRTHYEFIDRIRQQIAKARRQPASREEIIIALIEGLSSHPDAVASVGSLEELRERIARGVAGS
jgi:ATP-dependent Clp protease ATP-binding subunit ClpA